MAWTRSISDNPFSRVLDILRTWLSIVLFGVGILLFISLFVYGWKNGFASNPFVCDLKLQASNLIYGFTNFALSMKETRPNPPTVAVTKQ